MVAIGRNILVIVLFILQIILTVISVSLANSQKSCESLNLSNTLDRVSLLSLQEIQQYFNVTETWTDYVGIIHDETDFLWLFSIGGSKDLITSSTAYAMAQGAFTIPDYHDTEGKESCYWWLRSPGYVSDYAACISSPGGVDANGYSVDDNENAVRPALWVDLVS